MFGQELGTYFDEVDLGVFLLRGKHRSGASISSIGTDVPKLLEEGRRLAQAQESELEAHVSSASSFVRRPTPAAGSNSGSGIEVVAPPGA